MASLDERIIQAAEGIPGISVLVVFGSRAKDTARPDSDLDVAVLPESGDPKARRTLLTSLAVALADLAPEGRVDVVFLDEANDVLRQRVMETGRVLICRDRDAWIELRVRTMRVWVRDLMQRAQRRRLEGGLPSGRSGTAVESLRRLGKLSR